MLKYKKTTLWVGFPIIAQDLTNIWICAVISCRSLGGGGLLSSVEAKLQLKSECRYSQQKTMGNVSYYSPTPRTDTFLFGEAKMHSHTQQTTRV